MVVGGLGRLLVAFGVLVLLFVVYLLWGTGLLEAAHQNALRQQFEHELAGIKAHGSATTTTQGTAANQSTTTSTTPNTSGFVVPGSVPREGQPVGILQIPKLSLDKVIVEGTGDNDLRLGPGHYPGTPLPGQPGNAAIAGHRTTYGAPFYELNALSAGDSIYVTTTQGRFRYVVTHSLVVSPNDTQVVSSIPPTATPELTLTTCNPRFSASQRLVVQANLTSLPAPVPAPPPTSQSPSATPNHSKVPSSSLGLAGEQGSWTGALAWGAGALALVAGVWFLARRRRRRWATYAVGVVPVLIVLFFFFENVSPLLPASF